MGAPTKRARKIRSANEFDVARLRAALRMPKDGRGSVFAWSIADIRNARDQQLLGQFLLPARMAESMRTDDALAVAYENRLAPQRNINVALVAAKPGRGDAIAGEAQALFGQDGVGLSPETLADVNGCLVDHGVAFGVNVATPRADGSRVDVEMHYYPIEFVRWDPYYRVFKARVDPSSVPEDEISPVDIQAGTFGLVGGFEVPIVHGDGRWVIFKKHEIDPFKQEAALLPAAIVWARHAYAIRDWSKGSTSHGNAKVVGEMPAGVPLQDAQGNLSSEAAAFLELLRDIASGDAPVGIRPAGAKTDYLTNTSQAWQVWEQLVLNAEKAAARIYLGTDGTLGTQGGAPGIDIGALFGVAATKVEGDLRCIERGLQTGVIEPWCAINFGDSSLAPKRRYMIPDGDEDARTASLAKRNDAFYAALKTAKEAGYTLAPEYIAGLAKDYDVRVPTFTQVAPPAPAARSPPPAAQGAAAAAARPALRIVPPEPKPEPKPEPSAMEKAEHASRMNAALIADIREARALGLKYSQAQIDETAARYGVPAPQIAESQ